MPPDAPKHARASQLRPLLPITIASLPRTQKHFDWAARYHKIPKISLGAYIFQRPFLGGLIFGRGIYSEGLIIGGKFTLQNWLGLQLEGNLCQNF